MRLPWVRMDESYYLGAYWLARRETAVVCILTPERFTASNPAHVELARDVSERLARAGLLTPLRPSEE